MKLASLKEQLPGKHQLLGISVVALIAVVLIIRGGLSGHAETSTNEAPATVPTVSVAQVKREDLWKEVNIPAEFRAYEEVKLHAKVSGYLQSINVDIGDHVKAGQVIATLEVPELQAELSNAIATEKKAEADYTDAHVTYTRLFNVNKEHPNLVAEQDLDNAQAHDQSAAANLAAARADVDKYQTLLGYTKITSPFDGIITHRYADPGALIQAGTSSDTQSLPLVRLSDNYRLRLDFPVTVDYVKDVHVGDKVNVQVTSLDGKVLTGKVTRFANDIDDDTRTMTTELEVTNPDLQIVPGMYASVVLQVEKRSNVLTVPLEAVSGGKSPTVLVINQNHQIEVRPIKIGLETPNKYEVLSGLKDGDLVVIGSHSDFQAGQQVEPQLVALAQRP